MQICNGHVLGSVHTFVLRTHLRAKIFCSVLRRSICASVLSIINSLLGEDFDFTIYLSLQVWRQ